MDIAQGNVTLWHGALANLVLGNLKHYDKVRLTADKKDGTYFLTDVQVAK